MKTFTGSRHFGARRCLPAFTARAFPFSNLAFPRASYALLIAFNNGLILDEGTPSLDRRIPASGTSGSVSVYVGGRQDRRRIQLKMRHIRTVELPRFIRSCGVVKRRRRELRASIASKPLCARLRTPQPARELELLLAQSAALDVIPPA
jgi:hypothetical protein